MTNLSVFSISPHQPFGETLAAGILAEIGNAPERLGEVQILLPTRRACRALADSFLRLSGGQPLLLPRMQPLGTWTKMPWTWEVSKTVTVAT